MLLKTDVVFLETAVFTREVALALDAELKRDEIWEGSVALIQDVALRGVADEFPEVAMLVKGVDVALTR